MSAPSNDPPVAVITGWGRSRGIGTAVASALRDDGWRVVTAGWRRYDRLMPWGADDIPLADIEADLADPSTPAMVLERANELAGPVSAMILCHCESVDSTILDTSVESFDRHVAINARATWLLIKAFVEQFAGPPGTGRVAAITSDHTAFNMPYGASKAAMDRIVLAAAVEFAALGITCNVINPGATDTGWMDFSTAAAVRARNLQPRQRCAPATFNPVSERPQTAQTWFAFFAHRTGSGSTANCCTPTAAFVHDGYLATTRKRSRLSCGVLLLDSLNQFDEVSVGIEEEAADDRPALEALWLHRGLASGSDRLGVRGHAIVDIEVDLPQREPVIDGLAVVVALGELQSPAALVCGDDDLVDIIDLRAALHLEADDLGVELLGPLDVVDIHAVLTDSGGHVVLLLDRDRVVRDPGR